VASSSESDLGRDFRWPASASQGWLPILKDHPPHGQGQKREYREILKQDIFGSAGNERHPCGFLSRLAVPSRARGGKGDPDAPELNPKFQSDWINQSLKQLSFPWRRLSTAGTSLRCRGADAFARWKRAILSPATVQPYAPEPHRRQAQRDDELKRKRCTVCIAFSRRSCRLAPVPARHRNLPSHMASLAALDGSVGASDRWAWLDPSAK
jgi:hypothetical protein